MPSLFEGLSGPKNGRYRPGKEPVIWCYLQLMTKAELYRLVDALPDESLPAAAILLRRAQDPVVAKLDAAPVDGEELSDEDRRAIREARQERGIAWSEVEAELNAD